MTILVVDDQIYMVKMMRSMLLRTGVTVLTAMSRASALEAARSNPIDVLVMDVVLEYPSDGWQLAREILDFSPQARVLLISGLPLEDPLPETLPTRWAFLPKPFDKAGLLSAVAKLIAYE